MESGGRWDGDNGDMEIGYLWEKSLGESWFTAADSMEWNPRSWESGSLKSNEFGRYNPTEDIMRFQKVSRFGGVLKTV